jgi:DNA ligase (NAD+)
MTKRADDVQKLEAEIRHHNALYWDAQAPEISDESYDKLVLRLKQLNPASQVLLELGQKTSFGYPYKHAVAMLSLDKCYSDTELTEWMQSFEGDVVVIPKFDGIACALHYGDDGALRVAVTRGDGVTGDDITRNVLRIKDVPKRVPSGEGPLEVRGEIYMRLSVFARFKEEGMANPRNLTAGAIKQKNADKSEAYELSFAAYDLAQGAGDTLSGDLARLEAMGFSSVEAVRLPKEKAASAFQDVAKRRSTLDFEIDGVVFKVDARSEQRRLGETSHHPRYAMAYKLQGEAGTSELLSVEWSVARTGAITPVAIVAPVFLSGVTVSRASLHNVAFIDRLGLTLGAIVTLVRRGGVIPNVEFVNTPGTAPVQVPETCPRCGSAAVRMRDFLYCSAPASCPSVMVAQLAHFASAVDLLGFGDVILEQAFAAGILRTPVDFYKITQSSLEKLDRCGEKTAKKLIAEVQKKKELELATFLRALGIHELGKNVSGMLAAKYGTLDAVLSVTVDELAQAHGIGDSIASSVVAGFASMKAEIDALREHITFKGSAAPVQGRLTGISFVFTGKMVAFARNEGEKRVRSLGGDVHGSVTKALAYLVVGADKSGPASSKEKAAEKLLAAGATLKVLSETEFLAMVDA